MIEFLSMDLLWNPWETVQVRVQITIQKIEIKSDKNFRHFRQFLILGILFVAYFLSNWFHQTGYLVSTFPI